MKPHLSLFLKSLFVSVFVISAHICLGQWNSTIQSPACLVPTATVSNANLVNVFNMPPTNGGAGNISLMSSNWDLGAGFGLIDGANVVSPIVWMYDYGGRNAFTIARKSYSAGVGQGSWSDYITPLFQVRENGKVGIGTVDPVINSNLDVAGGGINIGGTGNLDATLHIKASYGGLDRLTQIHPSLNDKPALNLKASKDAGGNHHWWSWGVLNNGVWAVQPSTSFEGQTGFFIDRNGRVGVATNSPDEALAVRGNIHTQEVRVDLTGAVAPDYVFEKDYSLLPLPELEVYINQNKHLPEIPSAKEMEENGLNLKEMNLLLLKKMEEITLYMIEMKKENNRLTEENKVQHGQIELLLQKFKTPKK